jgi:hypothetical protein
MVARCQALAAHSGHGHLGTGDLLERYRLRRTGGLSASAGGGLDDQAAQQQVLDEFAEVLDDGP